jgi:DNA-binding response OmpR family regulator
MQVDPISRILIVDGTDEGRKELREALHPGALRVDEAGGVREAFSVAVEAPLDLVLAEVRLPDASGFSLCRLLREEPACHDLPVILVSSWATEMDRVIAFECGADDFLARPFFGRELGSRVAAVLRRRREREAAGLPARPERFVPAPATLHREVRVAGRLLDLTPKETAILVHLATSDGAVRSRRRLIEAIWGDESTPSDRCIDSHVKSLRRKLGVAGDAVETVRGVGYRFAPHPDLELD